MTETLSHTLVEETNRFGKKDAMNKTHATTAVLNDNRPGPNYTVVLQPQTNQFPTKTLEIRPGTQCKIGRQSGAKTAPKPLNGYFDSKVLSRTHAVVWCDQQGVFIRDTKSSNGTFLNGLRLSKEGEESTPFALKTGDYIEFGIDIFSEDNNVLLYQKVACYVAVFNTTLEQLDRSTLQQFNINPDYNNSYQIDPYPPRRSSTSSLSTITYHSVNNKYPASPTSKSKRSKNLDLLVAKLEAELERSQQMEKELKVMAAKMTDLNKTQEVDQVKTSNALSLALQQQLQDAQQKNKLHEEKTRLQNQAISAARQQIKTLEGMLQKTTTQPSNKLVTNLQHELDQLRLQMDQKGCEHNKQLIQEREHSIALERRCLALEKQLRSLEAAPKEGGFFAGFVDALQVRSMQLLLGFLMAVISALVYLLLL